MVDQSELAFYGLDETVFTKLQAGCAALPTLGFATLSGSHVYGFPSANSDYDVRGCHILPLEQVISLHDPKETIELHHPIDGLEWDLVTHDIKKFFKLLMGKNGYSVEQVFSPIVLHDCDWLPELREITSGLITRFHWYHYRSFAIHEWSLFCKQPEKRVKRMLYIVRILLAGRFLLESGIVQINLPRLLYQYKHIERDLDWVQDLIAMKCAGVEGLSLPDTDVDHYKRHYDRLQAQLERAGTESLLPDHATSIPALNDLLIRVRLQSSSVPAG